MTKPKRNAKEKITETKKKKGNSIPGILRKTNKQQVKTHKRKSIALHAVRVV